MEEATFNSNLESSSNNRSIDFLELCSQKNTYEIEDFYFISLSHCDYTMR